MDQSILFNDLKEYLKSSKDVFISYNKEINFTIFFQEQLCNITVFNRDILPNIKMEKTLLLEDNLTGLARVIKFNDTNNLDMLLQILFSGLMLYYDHNRDIFLLIDLSQALRRSTSDSIIEPKNILGSRDGFTENFKDNIALIRTRIKSSNLCIDEVMVGKRSKTYAGLLSIGDITNQDNKLELLEKLKNIDIDAVLNFNDIINNLDGGYFKYEYIGSPDLASKQLLMGQMILILDRIPLVLVFPTTFGTVTELRIDEIGNPFYKIFQKSLMLFALLFSTLIPALLLSFLTFQSDSVSLTLISTFLVTQKGSVFPLFIEILMILLLFEFYYLISFRSSEATISSTIVLIGGLIIGQNAIQSGLVGVIVMTIVALSFLSTFVVSNNISIITSISLTRLVALFSSLLFGIYGVTLTSILILMYLSNQKFLGVNFTKPFIPLNFNDLKLFFFSRNNKSNKKRLNVMKTYDRSLKK